MGKGELMKIYDDEWNEVVEPDLDVGYLEPVRRFVAHHDAIPERERIEEYDLENPIAEYPNGGKEVAVIVVQEYAPAVDAWDEYEDAMRFVLYTEEELVEIAKRKEAEKAARAEAERQAREAAEKEAERESFLAAAPKRMDAIEATQLDADESVVGLYESASDAQLEIDEAITGLYEMIGAMK